jgi:hypothetical protein
MPLQADQRLKKKIYHSQENNNPAAASQRWWLVEEKENIYQHVFAVCEDILTNLAIRRRMNYFFAALYNDTGAAFMASRNTNLYYNRTALDGNAMLNSRMSLNVLQNCIDTAASMIAKNKPKPQFLTDGSLDYATKVKGKKITKYIEGVFDEMHIYEVMRKVFIDACIYGTGVLKLSAEDGKIRAENLFIEEILIDDLEGMHEKPTQIHQRKFLPRDVVIAMFPDEIEKIESAQTVSGGTATFSTADIIPIIESWHLRSGPRSKDGMHVISIENCTLLSEPYEKDYFPILFFRWANQTLGFWGRGICHEIWKLQRELDIILQTIQLSQRLISGPLIAVESGSNIAEDHITSNKLAKIVEYSVTPPQYLLPPIVQPELYEHAQYLEDRMYKITGISQANATGTKPPEVKSGAAIREVNDIAEGRFQLISQKWEETFLDIAKICVDLSADMLKDGEKLSVLTSSSKGAERLVFKDVITDMENCKLQLFPVSGLPSTPAGRLDQLMDYAQAGYLSKEQVMDIVDFPDLEDTVSLETAALHLTQEILSQIKLKGKYVPPGPYLDLQVAYRMVCLEIDRATLQEVEEDNIELLRRWANEVQDLQKLAQAQAQPPQPQPNAGTPGQTGMPMAASQMPNQPQQG